MHNSSLWMNVIAQDLPQRFGTWRFLNQMFCLLHLINNIQIVTSCNWIILTKHTTQKISFLGFSKPLYLFPLPNVATMNISLHCFSLYNSSVADDGWWRLAWSYWGPGFYQKALYNVGKISWGWGIFALHQQINLVWPNLAVEIIFILLIIFTFFHFVQHWTLSTTLHQSRELLRYVRSPQWVHTEPFSSFFL